MFFLLAKGDDAGGACAAFLIFGIFIVVGILSKLSANRTASEFERIRQNGRAALGIILKIDAIGTTLQGTASRFSGLSANGSWTWIRNSVHRKNARIDVEIPGQKPYEVSTSVLMPLNMAGDILPGSTVELRIDAANPSKIVIVGPGSGFSGFAQIPVTFHQDGSA